MSQRRAGFTLVEVIVSLTLLAVALLGLAAVAALSATSLRTSLVHEQAVRHAAGLLDSLTFAAPGGRDSALVAGVRYRWASPAGANGEIQVEATLPNSASALVRLDGRRIRLPGTGAP